MEMPAVSTILADMLIFNIQSELLWVATDLEGPGELFCFHSGPSLATRNPRVHNLRESELLKIAGALVTAR